MLRCGTCNAAVIRTSCFPCWKHPFLRFSSSSASGGELHPSPVPSSLNPPSRPKHRRRRRQGGIARKKSPPPKVRPKAVGQPSPSPDALLERISMIVGSGGRKPASLALPAGEDADVGAGGEDVGMCGQGVRRNAPENFLEMTGSIREEEEAKLVCSGGGAFSRAEDVGPAVQKITEIVRAANHGTASMEERLESSGVVFTPEVVEIVLKRCFKAGHSALRFFHWARRQLGFSHPTATYNAVLYIAGEAREFDLIEKLLEWMREDSCPTNVKTWTILIYHYGKAKQIGKALWAFEQMKRRCGCEPDKMAYEAIIRASCEAGKAEIAMEFYKEMVGEAMTLDYNLYQVLLNCLAVSGDVMTLRSVGEHMVKVASENAVYSSMLKSLFISGRIEEARELVDEIKKKNLTLDPGCAEVLVKGLSKAGRVIEALKIVEDAKKDHISNNKVYGHVIGGYLRLGDVQKAIELLENLKELGSLPKVSTYTEIIQHLFRSGEYQKACELFDEMLEDGIEPDVVAVTAVVAGHVRSGRILEAWNVFEDMKKKGMTPTWKSYSVFIKELCRMSKPEEAFKLLIEMAHLNLNPKHGIFHLVISSLRRKGELEKVRRAEQISRFFNVQILDSVQVNLPSVEEPKFLDWSVDLHRQSNQRPKAFKDRDLRDICNILSTSQNWVSMTEDLKKSTIHFTPEFVEEILRSCQRYGRAVLQFFSWVGKLAGYAHTTETYNMAIKISGSGKDFSYMRHLYQEMKRRGCPINADTWTIMIAQYGQAGLTEMALKKFKDMKDDGFLPNGNTYKFLIMFLCGKKGRKLPEAITTFHEMLRAGYMPDKELVESYLSCLCESGKIHEARGCMETLRKHGFTAQTGYSLLTKCLCRAGLLEEAMMLVNELSHLGCEVDQYIYGSLVHGLLRGGRQEEALCKIEEMKKSGIQLTVAIYTSLIVHFFKERHVAMAMEMFKKMREDGFEPTVVTYSALIRGYISAGMISDAWDIYYRMVTKGPLPDFHTYSMFITCLCRVGRSEEGLQLLHDMLGRGIFPSTINFRTVSYGFNREGKQDLAHTVLQAKWRLSRERKIAA